MNAHSVLNKPHLVHLVGDFLTPDEVTTLARNRSAMLPSRSSFGEINFDFANTRDNIKKIKSLDDFKMVMESISKIKNMCTKSRFSKDRYLKPLIDDLIDSRNTMSNQDFWSSNRVLLDFMRKSNDFTSINTLIPHLRRDDLTENELNKIMRIVIDTENLSPDLMITLIDLYPPKVSIETIFEIQLAMEGLDAQYSQAMAGWIKKFAHLPKEHITGVFNRAFDLLEKWGQSSSQAMAALIWGYSSSQAMTALVEIIGDLPMDQRKEAFDRTLDVLKNWGSVYSEKPMAKLAFKIRWLPEDQKTEAFHGMLDILKHWDKFSRTALAALSLIFRCLPEDHRTEARDRAQSMFEKTGI